MKASPLKITFKSLKIEAWGRNKGEMSTLLSNEAHLEGTFSLL